MPFLQGYFISCDYLLEKMKISRKISCITSVQARVLIFLLLLPISLCVEVYVSMEPNDCDDQAPPSEADEPVYVCISDEKDSKKIILHCCTDSRPCIGWTGEWWYRDASDPNSSFKKYLAASQSAWVYVNDTDYPIRYLCNITSSHECEKGSGYIDIQRGLSPKISVVNHTDILEVTTDTTKVSLYFEIFASPRLTLEPQLTVNDSDLSPKWKIIYKSLNMNRIIHYANWSHFLIELTTEEFTKEDGGVYMLTVSNNCSSSNRTVTISVRCKDTVEILPDGAGSHHECHTVEGRTVSFSYRCTGIDVINWWGVDGHKISTYPFKFDESNSSFGCKNHLTLTLYDVTLDYSNTYTAYPSTSTHFSITGINLTFHLRVHKYPRLYEALRPLVYNETAQLECIFTASDYDYPHLIQPVWRKGLNLVMQSPPKVVFHSSWSDDKFVTKLIISPVTSVDSGEYFCSINYSTDIMKESISSNHGRILLNIGSSSTASKSEEVPIIVGSVAGTLLLVFMIAILIIGILLYKKTRPSYIRDEYTRLIERDGSNNSVSSATLSTDSHRSDDIIDNYDKRSVT